MSTDPSLPIPSAAPARLSNEELVFGVGFKRDEHGRPIEQGHGAKGHETSNHLAALERMNKIAEAQNGGDFNELRKLIKELVQPPEDMTPEQKAKAEAAAEAEVKQEERIGDLEGRVGQLDKKVIVMDGKLDAILSALKPDTSPKNEGKAQVDTF